MRELTPNEISIVSGGSEDTGEERDSSDVASGLTAVGGALVTLGGAVAMVPGGQIPGVIIAADGLLLMGSGGLIQIVDGFGS